MGKKLAIEAVLHGTNQNNIPTHQGEVECLGLCALAPHELGASLPHLLTGIGGFGLLSKFPLDA